jgi:hypothetical protein
VARTAAAPGSRATSRTAVASAPRVPEAVASECGCGVGSWGPRRSVRVWHLNRKALAEIKAWAIDRLGPRLQAASVAKGIYPELRALVLAHGGRGASRGPCGPVDLEWPFRCSSRGDTWPPSQARHRLLSAFPLTRTSSSDSVSHFFRMRPDACDRPSAQGLSSSVRQVLDGE